MKLRRIFVRDERDIPFVVDATYVAELFGVTVRTVYNEIERGHIHANRIGREWRISRDEIVRLAKGGN